MGDRGPTPLRAEERRRTNEPAHPIWKLGPEELAQLPFDIELSPAPPELPSKSGDRTWLDEHQDSRWGRQVTELYEGLKTDPAVAWMTSGDWSLLMLLLEDLDRELKPQVVGLTENSFDPDTREVIQGGEPVYAVVPMKASKLSGINQFMKAFGFGEANRLRMQKEVTLFQQQTATIKPEGGEEQVVASRLELLQGGQSS